MITWLLETGMFADGHARLADAARGAGHNVIQWNDDWWSSGKFPTSTLDRVVFHGNLENASRIALQKRWEPGAFCSTNAFACSTWYPAAEPFLAHRSWRIVPAAVFVDAPDIVLAELNVQDRFFVRPDSPLKPFAGRVLDRDGLTLRSLDHGFYFEDASIPIVVAPVIDIESEWRFVIVDGLVIAGSGYEADGRTEIPTEQLREEWSYAQQVARSIPAPELVYVMDICRTDGEFRLLELGPFSGADLYAFDRRAVVGAVASALGE